MKIIMTDTIHPAMILIIGALFVPIIRGRFKSAYMLILPLLAFIALLRMPEGKYWIVDFMSYQLIFARVDNLSMAFGYIFIIITVVGVLFALKVEDDLQHVSALIYAGSAVGVTFAGDLITLYLFWEMLAISSTFLVLARRTKASRAAALRYVLVHIFGGLCLLAGIVFYIHNSGTAEFDYIGLTGIGSYLLFLGIALNAAAPPLHPWLPDAYPQATVTGAVFMCAFTTKSAVYVMARTFPGTELLIWVGAFMAVFPILYAALENDIRKVLSYSLINQVGFMLCGIGIGTALAINGAVAHAFCHILYKGLLFMAAGSVLHMTGKIRCTDLGGLYKTMPLTCLFCIIGVASIAGFPLFSGFVSKSMIVSAAAYGKLAIVWLILQFAAACAFPYADIKVPFFTFFNKDSGIRANDPPLNMLLAMGIAAFLCIAVAVFPGPLYNILPYPVHYVPYTAAHVVGQLQVLLFGGLAFCLLILSGYYPSEMRAINLDTDWFYRKGLRVVIVYVTWLCGWVARLCEGLFIKILPVRLGELSSRPLSALVVYYMRAAGRNRLKITEFQKQITPEKANIVPMGTAVLVSLLVLFSLFITFVLTM
jgi:multicomponent Na+:H+ antiporter subunit D